MNNFKIDSSDGSSENGDKKNKLEDLEQYEIYSNMVESADVVSANVGTSNKSSNSIRNPKAMSKNNFSDMDLIELDEGTVARMKELKKDKGRMNMAAIIDNITLGALFGTAPTEAGHVSNKSLYNLSQVLTTVDYDLTNEDYEDNYLEHMTVIAEEPNQTHDGLDPNHKLKRTVVTVLLTQKWHHDLHRGAGVPVPRGKQRYGHKKKKQIRFYPTYRMTPKCNINQDDATRRALVVKLKQTFRSLVEKHGKYDQEYTPRFLKIVTEMMKNDVKSMKLDRFKVLVFSSIFQKKGSHSAMFISRELKDLDNDSKIEINEETNTFYAICLVYLIYTD
jgi:hypothetical protein